MLTLTDEGMMGMRNKVAARKAHTNVQNKCF